MDDRLQTPESEVLAHGISCHVRAFSDTRLTLHFVAGILGTLHLLKIVESTGVSSKYARCSEYDQTRVYQDMENDSDGSEYAPDDDPVETTKSARKATHGARAGTQHAGRPRAARRVSSSGSRQRSSSNGLKAHLSKRYLDLLNDDIAEINHGIGFDDGHLAASQIGASYWSIAEKEACFRQLCLSGPGNLETLASAIGTKSAPEVQAYVLLLQEGVRELENSSKASDRFTFEDVPAACEVSPECEDLATLAADAIAERVESDDAEKERETHGQWWLIDETTAGELEDQFEAEDSAHSPTDQHVNDQDGVQNNVEAGPDDHAGSLAVPAANLLDSVNFLKLSSRLFMNSASDPDANWHTHLDPNSDQDGPSIYRTAFDDFHNLAVSLTRRLVQASIFQALSRLRSASDSRLVPAVNGNDVAAAVDIVGSKVDRDKYWATAARRCGVEVYSEADKFRDGRPGTKRGFKLTYEEVERELGMVSDSHSAGMDDDESVSDGAIDELDADDDAFTDGSEHPESHLGENEVIKDVAVSPDHESRGCRNKPQTRKRGLSPHSFDRAEDEYLEQLDQINSIVEDNRLRGILGLALIDGDVAVKPAFSYKRTKTETRGQYWRDVVQYEAPWEQHGHVPVEAFEAMGAEGKQGKRRREALRKAWEQREQGGEIESAQDEPGEGENVSESGASGGDAVGGAKSSPETEDVDEDETEDS